MARTEVIVLLCLFQVMWTKCFENERKPISDECRLYKICEHVDDYPVELARKLITELKRQGVFFDKEEPVPENIEPTSNMLAEALRHGRVSLLCLTVEKLSGVSSGTSEACELKSHAVLSGMERPKVLPKVKLNSKPVVRFNKRRPKLITKFKSHAVSSGKKRPKSPTLKSKAVLSDKKRPKESPKNTLVLRGNFNVDVTPLCNFVTKSYAPKSLPDEHGKPQYILNDDTNPTYTFTMQICQDKNPIICNKSTSSESPFPTGYTGVCIQRYMSRRLYYINKQNKAAIENFPILTTCVCGLKVDDK